MATQRTSVKVTKIIEVSAEELEQIILRHYTNGIGSVTFDVTSGGYFTGVTVISETEESNKTEKI